jgi:hypothetical protein
VADDALIIDDAAFSSALSTMVSQSKRGPLPVMLEQARGVGRKLVGITPPSHIVQAGKDEDGNALWNVVQGGAAKRHGEAVVKSDIYKVYGTPGGAYAAIKAAKPALAAPFWIAKKKNNQAEMQRLFFLALGRSLNAFDGGTRHEQLRNNQGRVSGRNLKEYTYDEKELKAYIKKIQSRVGWLAAGWNDALAGLGISPATWIARHDAPGKGSIIVNDDGIEITLTNSVRFASQISDMQRRVQYAVDSQTEAMERRMTDYLQKLCARNGFTVAAILS